MTHKKIIVVNDYNGMSKAAADMVVEKIRQKPDCVLGLPTGQTSIGMYKEMVKLLNAKVVDVSKVSTFNLDEYVGLGPEDEHSFHYFMQKHFFSKVDIHQDNIHLPNGLATDFEIEGARYEEKIRRAGGIDLQVVGIGINGHIGFNEPGSDFNSRTRVVALTEATRKINSIYFEKLEQVPRKAITLGLGNIMNCRRVLLIAAGEEKSVAIAKALRGPVVGKIPASVLQMHDNLTVVLDRSAAILMKSPMSDLRAQ